VGDIILYNTIYMLNVYPEKDVVVVVVATSDVAMVVVAVMW
jgi:hypothetical protein